MSKPFFFRITAGDLMDFATDPEGENMTLFQFAKELQKGQSKVQFIQSIIDEAHNYIEKKKISGSKGGKAKASTAIAPLENALANSSTALANSSTPLASSSSSSSSNKEESKDKNKVKRFVIPSVEEITAYCQERGNGVDPQKFFDHYEARGWIPKGYTKQMTNWKAAVRTWESSKAQLSVVPKTELVRGTPEYNAALQKRLAY